MLLQSNQLLIKRTGNRQRTGQRTKQPAEPGTSVNAALVLSGSDQQGPDAWQ